MIDALAIFAARFFSSGDCPQLPASICIPSLTGAADAFLALALAQKDEQNRVVLVITPGLPDADRLVDDLTLLTQSTACIVNRGSDQQVASNQQKPDATRILSFPPSQNGDKSALGTRFKTIAALRAWDLSPYPCVIVAPFSALQSPLQMGSDPIRLDVAANSVNLSEIGEKLAKIGYERREQVEAEGDFSIRGGILDVWSPGDEFPIRAEFFGDELESVRTFNPATQTSIKRIDSCEIYPVSEENHPSEKGSDPFSILKLLPENAAILALEHNEYLSGKSDLLVASPLIPIVYTGDPAPKGVASYAFQTVPLPGFAELGADEAHHPELFDAARKRLEQHLVASERRGIAVVKIDDLSGGFEIPGLIVATKADRVFTKRKVRGIRDGARARNSGPRLSDFDDLEPGEYVVHVDYGVGRYIGSSEILVDGKRSEVFTIEYADGGKLHVPATHAHLLSRYVGVNGETVRMHSLDGKRWSKDKQDAQKAVADLAAGLLETQAKRETIPGFACSVPCEGLDAFEAAFPYEETPDQIAAIAAVKRDLATRKPMDRLICGDAGYGKTEVAMRAAFIAAMNGKQVAVLAPTTVLAEQHFETFTSRFDGTPIRVESCSRFQSSGTHSGTFQRLATGACDIVIGTHALLSSKVCFHDLGLIIIDEEQRFGVRHKEFLKHLRATADVLTMSATPIPRTLYLSMTGARDLSLLRSPPRERVAVETRIVRDSDEIVRAAIRAELMRGGQVYFLHNRVNSIHKIEKRLREICPRARIVVAHGQMESRTLAKKMRDFERGRYDILLSTTIIESGIDIPRANTILIDQAHTFGLADLYQLRGRVGRSSRQGYAVLLLPASGSIDAEARERLAALKRHGGLGAGFNLAVRDLELRGAGNLLGSQQSGHIAAVGFNLYCQLLQRTIAKMKGERVKDVIDVKLNLDFAQPRIPYDYIEEDVQRLSLIRRFAEAQDLRVVKALAAEMRDRFGPPPDEAKEFVRIAELRVVCAEAGIDHLDVTGRRAVFYRAGSRDIFKVADLRATTTDRKITELIAAAKV